MESFFRQLSSNLQHGIVHSLGWRELRPVQEEAFVTLLDGANAVILAPTAGGKTEAAILPIVESLLRKPSRSVGALFISPLKALLNNQEDRVIKLAGLGGLTAFKWHGDVSSSAKRDFHRAPAGILMLTPESLEVILAVPRYEEERLFSDLRFVVIDEVHAFVGSHRGDHLNALLERLTQYSGCDFQRVALSATVQNPELILEWLQGTSKRPARLVRPSGATKPRDLEFHPLSAKEDGPQRVLKLAQGLKSLVFADSRAGVEKLRHALSGTGLEPFVHHGSLSKDLREEAEEAFRRDRAACIICTSTLELGLDVGDLDLVIQIDAPSSVSSFQQRIGRTGRRPGTQARLAFVTDEKETLLQACALVSLSSQRWVEPVTPTRHAAGVYVQQVLARILQGHGAARSALIQGVGAPYCFSELTEDERSHILDHLLETDVLAEADSLLVFGETAERRFGSTNYMDLYTVIDVTQEMTVVTTNNRVIGTIESWFAQSLKQKDFVFVLGGKPWLVVDADWGRSMLIVSGAPKGAIPAWLGDPKLLSPRICGEMRSLLLADEPPVFLGDAAADVFRRLQAAWQPLLQGDTPVLAADSKGVELITFAGGRINRVFTSLLKQWLGLTPVQSNLMVRLGQLDGVHSFQRVIDLLKNDPESVRAELLKGLDDSLAAKFEDLLPEVMWRRAVFDRVFDLHGARALAAGPLARVDRN